VWFPSAAGCSSEAYRARGRHQPQPAARQTLGIVGESGSGKSTLGQAILRLLDSRAASASRARRSSAQPEADAPVAPQMQVVFQDPFGSLSPRMSVQQIISEGLEVHAPMAWPSVKRR
jgi:ABC-type microcin C transport system duplicated ATPase subunit YejF